MKVEQGKEVKKGQPLLVLSAMKMETIVSSPMDGKVKRIAVAVGDEIKAGDLLVELE
jgi:pyruvate carboxylase